MLDGLLIFFGLFYIIIEYRRGFFCSFTDFCGMILGLRVFWVGWEPLSKWYFNQGFAPTTAYVLGSLTSFLPFAVLMIFVGWFIYHMTLISVGDAFDPILAGIFATAGFFVLGRFAMLVLGGLNHPELQQAIMNSFIGHELYTLEEVLSLLKRLEPLTNPGGIYL